MKAALRLLFLAPPAGDEETPRPVGDEGVPQSGGNTEFHERSKRSETTIFPTGEPTTNP